MAEELVASQVTPVLPPVTLPPTVIFGNAPAGIVGVKYNDQNRNGIRDANEPGISNVQIFIDTNNNGTRDANEPSTLTNATGNFAFTGLLPGVYTVREIPPAGFTPTTPNPVTVTLTGTNASISFGNATGGGQIIGCKYLDVDNDGFRDGSEPPMQNVRIYIDSNNNGQLDTGEPSTLTDRNGEYRFTNLAPGLYRIREERANGPRTEPLERDFPQSTPPGSIPLLDINLGLNEIWACAQVGNTPLYEIPVFKFRDDNGNGRQDAGEIPLQGIPFIIDLNRNGKTDPGEPRVLTGPDGRATFRDLKAGSYSVLETFEIPIPQQPPIATTDNPVEVTAPGARSRQQGTLPFRVADATVPGGQRIVSANFPPPIPPVNPEPSVFFTPIAINPTTGAVGNTRPNITVFKYNDKNANGRYEPGNTPREGPISGVRVYIDANDNGALDTGEQSALTNADGRAAFTNLPAGNYVVREVVPNGFSPTTAARVQFSLSNQDANVVFGNTPNSRITGCKFQDLNNNGYRDGFESPIPGVTIYLDNNGNNALDAGEPTSVSDQFGRWSFGNLAPGVYRVREVVPANAFQTTQQLDVVLGANQTFTCALVGNGQFYTLRVPKFRDDNRNGVQDAGEPPLQNIPFTLDLNRNGRFDAATEPLARTDANGIATFTNLAPGTYSVLEVFNDPTVTNPFPIPTGPNPVTFTVPGPNASVTPISTTATRTASGIDELTGTMEEDTVVGKDLLNDSGLLAASQQDSTADTFFLPESAAATTFVNFDELKKQAEASAQMFVDTQQEKDRSLLLFADS